ncbi:hypothetical protein [Actinomadura sp. 21ATH]|uniref:hypothetical protein n=1 Tax=Actinomadura sp. 21ATH TaxID=1735444 RepID=UPI0035C24211
MGGLVFLTLGLAGGLTVGGAGGLALGLAFADHYAWPAYLAVTFWRRLPQSLMVFLDDAHRLGLLRAVGPIYQFQHTELHDHLAAAYHSQPDPPP